MSDNSKKYLWIAAAASAFLLVVAAAAFFVFRPTPTSSRTPFDSSGTAEAKQTVTTDYVAESGSTESGPQAAEGDKSGDVYIVYGDKGQPTTTVVSTQTTKSVAEQPTPTTISVAPTTTTTIRAVAPAPTKTVQVKPAAPAGPAPAPTAKPTTTAAASGSYWIQAGSFSKQSSANASRDFLISKHFSVEIKTVGEAYKVRIGPYATKAEASNMLPSVKLIKGYEQAWITQ